MKKVILLMLFACSMFASLCSNAQSPVDWTLKDCSKRIINIEDNLNKAHKEFQVGLVMQLSGIGLTGAGFITGEGFSPLFIAGGILTTIGWITMIDSHKFIGRAGNNNGLAYIGNGISYRF